MVTWKAIVELVAILLAIILALLWLTGNLSDLAEKIESWISGLKIILK